MRATLEESFYNVNVTATELWQQVGRILAHARVDRQWSVTDVERAGGPSYKTVQTIERGAAGHVDSLDKCARALDLSIVDILQNVLAAQLTPLSPEAAQIVRKFTQTTVAGRQAMLSIALALPLEVDTPRAPGAATPTADGPPPLDPPARARRTAPRPNSVSAASHRVAPTPPSQPPLSARRKRQPTREKKHPQ